MSSFWRNLLLTTALLNGNLGAFDHFEGRQTHPVATTPDGARLLALNTPEGRLSVFDISSSATAVPQLVAEIVTGLEPVSLRARTNDEIWVVNEVSDSVAIVSLSKRAVTAVLPVPDEPADIVFAGGKAFVSCSRSHQVRVFDAVSRQALGTVTFQAVTPKSLAVSPDQSKVYVSFLLSGNRTTTLPPTLAPAPPAPTNTALPAAPQTGLIVPASDSRITYTVLDHDAAEIAVSSLAVTRYFDGLGTNMLDLAVRPGGAELWVPNTEALNLIRFEPALKGHFADHRVSRVNLSGGTVSITDLNAGLNLAIPAAPDKNLALAQPSALVFTPDGNSAWVAATGSDRVARLDPNGTVLARADLRSVGTAPATVRGPRGLALSSDGSKLYVLNKLSNTVSVVDTASANVLAEVPAGSHDPLSAETRAGRGFLNDARLSGNGTMSCAVCHIDADRDGLAWDLGDPGGEMVTVMGANLSAHDTTLRPRVLHPMKGPMVTQPLRGLGGQAPFHWRGDKATLQAFNGTFRNLMAGNLLSDADINALAAYLGTLRHHPNPNRNFDRTLPASFNGGNPTKGRDLYNNHLNHCVVCHALPSGSDLNLDLAQEVGSSQPLKNPSFRTVYQRIFFNPKAGQTSLSGFGLGHDGSQITLPTPHPYVLDQLSTTADFADLAAFVLCFDTGTAPTVGFTQVVTRDNAADPALASLWTTLEAQASATSTASDLAATGFVANRARSYLFNKTTQRYQSDRASDPVLTRAQLTASLAAGDTLLLINTLPGQGGLWGGDRDGDGVRDSDEPVPALTLSRTSGQLRASWPASAAGWVLERSSDLITWEPETAPASLVDSRNEASLDHLPFRRFLRLRRAW